METIDETGLKYIHYGDIHTKVADIIDSDTNLPYIKLAKYEFLQQGDVIVADASEDYQGIAEPAVIIGITHHNIVAGLHTIVLRSKRLMPLFLYYVLHSEQFKKYGHKAGTGMKVFGITYLNLSKYDLAVPALEEQKNIGEFFRSLDQQITVNERKVKNLKLMKKSLLQKMFPKDGSEYPELRFPEYTDAWVKRQFGELYQKVNEKNDLSFTKDKVISVANMYFKKDAEIHSDDSYMKTYNVFCKGDIAFEGNRNKHFSYGRFVENTIGDGIVSHVFDVFRPITEFDLNYWKYAIHNERVMGPILMTATTSSTMMTNLVAKDFLKRTMLVPSVLEQTKIGTFFQTLDQLITVNERKVKDLKKQKKALLQKMFV